jgi:hypothetical protein
MLAGESEPIKGAIRKVSTIVFSIAVLGALGGLYVWAKRRAQTIRRLAEEREHAALAMMLGGKSLSATGPESEVSEASGEPPRKPMGRLLHGDADEQAAALMQAAAAAGQERPDNVLPPLEYERRNGSQREPTPAEQAAAELDPIEELISQIMVDAPAAPARPEQRASGAARSAKARYEKPDESAPRPGPMAASIPLRELALAWYEARGYRGSPASPAVWPIELVLRHREDAARAYAFVVQNDLVSVDRITALIEQAREIGMLRVAVIAEGGYERGAKDIARKRNVRLIDRRTMEAELADLQLPTAAKIIAVARTRASAEPSPA